MIRRPLARRRAHDATYAFIALLLVLVALAYACAVLTYFNAWTAPAHTWGFLTLLCAPSLALLALLIPVWSDWQASRPFIPRYARA